MPELLEHSQHSLEQGGEELMRSVDAFWYSDHDIEYSSRKTWTRRSLNFERKRTYTYIEATSNTCANMRLVVSYFDAAPHRVKEYARYTGVLVCISSVAAERCFFQVESRSLHTTVMTYI